MKLKIKSSLSGGIMAFMLLIFTMAPCAWAYQHPGIGLTLADLNYVKTNLNNAPWSSGYSALVSDVLSSTNYIMHGPFTYVNRNNGGNYDNESAWKTDMQAVYNLARMWYFTGDTNYAKRSHDILLAWANTQTNYGGIEASFDLGDYAYRYAGGADILRGTWPGWTTADTATVSNYFINVFWPDLGFPGPMATGSQGMEPLTAAVAISVFNDYTNKFNEVLTDFLADADSGLRDAYGNGEMGDTGRDQGHAGLYIFDLAWIAEAFWKQGVDVFSIKDNRIHACGEYFTRYNAGSVLQTNLPYVPIGAPFWGVFNQIGGNPGSAGLSGIVPNIIHNAYANRLGIQTPYIDIYGLTWDEDSFMFYRNADSSTAMVPAIASLPATASLTTGLTGADLNGNSPAGSSSYSGGIWTLHGGYNGGDPWYGGSDTVRFAYMQVTGDFTFVAEVNSISNVGAGNAKAGIMLRDSLGNAGERVYVAVTPNTTCERIMYGWTSGGLPYGNNAAAESYSLRQVPYWVKMERVGNRIQTYTSINGGDWAPAGTADYGNLGTTVYVGLFDTSMVGSTFNTATFSNVRLTGGDNGAPLQAPPAPFAIYASPGAGQVPLHWNESFMATNYTVQRSTNSGGPYSPLVTVTNLSYMDTNVTPGTTYYYVVTASNSAGTSANSLADSATTQLTPQQPPIGLTALTGNAQATLYWIAAGNTVGYDVKRSTTSGSGYVLVKNITGTSYVDTGLINGTTYYYVISSVNGAGEGASSSEASVTPNASAAVLSWSGAVNGSWDTSTMNWLNGGTSVSYASGNSVIFDDSSSSNTTINLPISCSPGTVFVNNTAQSYTISGGAIAGVGKLVKQGGGTITFNNANTYSGGSTVYNGTVTVGNNTAFGTGAIALNGGTLFGGSSGYTLANNISAQTNTTSKIDCSGNLTLNGNLTGGGKIIRGTSATLTLFFGGDNSGFTGVYQDQNNANSITRWNSPNSGSANARWVFNQAQVASRTTPNFGAGTIQFGSISGGGYISQNSSGTVVLQVGALGLNDTFTGSMQDGGGVLALTKVGSGTLTLTGANSYSGLTTVTNGELILASSFSNRGSCLVTNGAAFGLTNLSVASAVISNLTFATRCTWEFINVANTTVPLLLASNVSVGANCSVKITGSGGLVTGNTYPLVKYSGTLSGFANLALQMPYGWRASLASVGNQIVLTNVAVIATTPPLMNFGMANGQMQITWPADHTGWRLQTQTNALNSGLGTNWMDVVAAPLTNQVTIPVSTTNGSVFYRLIYP